MIHEPRNIGGLIGLVMVLVFAIVITYDIARKTIKRFVNGTDESDTTSIDLRGMIYIDLFIILIHIICITVNFVFSSDDFECEYITKICTFLFHLTRSVLYIIFVRRIQVIYGDTMFALKRWHLYLLYIIIAIYSIPYIVYFNWNAIKTEYDVEFGCLLQYESSIYIFTISALHILIAIYCLYLFVYPLYRLLLAQEDKQISYKLYNVLIKYSILYSSSICSSFILITLSYLLPFGYNYSIIDSLINGMILILLHPIHNRLYKSLCCPLHSICTFICDAPKNDDTSQNQQNELFRMKSDGTYKDTDNAPTCTDIIISAGNTMNHASDKKPKLEMSKPCKSNSTVSMTTIRKLDDDIDVHEFQEIMRVRTSSPVSLTPPNTISSQNDDVAVILEEEDKSGVNVNNEIELILDLTNTRSFKLDLTNTSSFKSFTSLEPVEFEKKKSNTLKVINYESTQL